MLDIVANVGWHAHDVERCVDAFDFKLANVGIFFCFEVVIGLNLQPVIIEHEVEIRVISGALSLSYAFFNSIIHSHGAIKLLNK